MKKLTSGRIRMALLSTLLILGACGDTSSDGSENSVTVGVDAGGDVSTDTGSQCGEPTGERPPQLSEHAGAFVSADDGSAGTVVIFGGSLGIPENCDFPERTYETTTWAYDVDCDSWSKLDSAATPPGRTRHTAIYDAAENRVIVYGGLGANGPLDDTWALDMDSGEWSEIETSGGPAPARLNHAAVYDPAGRMLVFGGNQGSSVVDIDPSNDVWELDLSTHTWTEVTPTQAGPEPRLWSSALWDDDQSQLVVYGGGDDSAFTGDVEYFDDAWAWRDDGDEPEWEELGAESTDRPAGRFWAGWSYDPVNQRYVLFAGHDAGNVDGKTLGNRNDTWSLDPATGEWTEHFEGDVWNKPANGFCDFPADFTIIDPESPERRNAHVFVSGPTGAYMMGG
ncbi:MAG: Kelch repeat-containing protein [Persicimonas sp.]